VAAALTLDACGTKMTVVPPAEPLAKIEFTLPGKIVYEGKADYLPRTLAADAAASSGLTLKYAYDVAYGKDRTHIAAHLFNPLVLFGFPIGEDTVAVAGKLEIVRGDEVLKTYTATCGFEKTRGIFYEGETYSELRIRGLTCVRENIEAQMHRERELLMRLTKGE
jgi:hypothetical protein